MRALLACCALVIATGPALAQGQLRMVPVPADATVVVPPRGAGIAPRLAPSPEAWERLRTQPPPAQPDPVAGAFPLAPIAGILLPLAAGALLGATVPGSGGGGGVAPAVTAAPP